MARPRFEMAWEEADTAAALKARYRSEARADRRMRLQGLWLLRSGRSVDEAAAAVGVHRRTVDRWVAWYRTGGLAAVLAHRQGGHGQPRKLTADHEAQVRAEVATGRFRTTAEVGGWIAATYGVRFQPGGVTSLLKRLRAAPKVPRPRHEKADPAAQTAWQRGGSPTRSRRRASGCGEQSAISTSCGWGCWALPGGAGGSGG
jgi:transposase